MGGGQVRIASVPSGDAMSFNNDLKYGAQFGVTPEARYLLVEASFDNIFDGRTPDSYQNLGLAIGTGDQSDYLKLVLEGGSNGDPYMRVEVENNDIRDLAQSRNYSANAAALENVDANDTVQVSLLIDTQTGIVVPRWAFSSNVGPGTFQGQGARACWYPGADVAAENHRRRGSLSRLAMLDGMLAAAGYPRSVPMPTPRQLSHELREGRSPALSRRRWVAGLSLLGSAMGGIVSLYQMGVLRRLPDLPFDLFDATRVDASDYAYKRLQTPDGLLMVASYATTAILAGAGGADRAREHPTLPVALAAKAIYDCVVALKLAREEWDDNRALCGYCQAATLASLASAALALPEAAQAVGHVLGGPDGDDASTPMTALEMEV